jgi:hypothetical protein
MGLLQQELAACTAEVGGDLHHVHAGLRSGTLHHEAALIDVPVLADDVAFATTDDDMTDNRTT